MAGLVRRPGAAVAAGDDCRSRDLAIRRFAGRSNDVLENVFALAPRGRRKRTPGVNLAVSGNQPCQAAGSSSSRRGRLLASKRSLESGRKFRRAVFALDPGPRALPDSAIPNDAAVPCLFGDQMRRPRAGHSVNHRTMSPTGSSGVSCPVDEFSRISIEECLSTRTSTSAAPVCFAARIARAISAWVRVAGRRLIIRPVPPPGTASHAGYDLAPMLATTKAKRRHLDQCRPAYAL